MHVTEHPVLKYLRPKLANFLNDFRRPDWFTRFGLPVSNGRHNQLSESQVRRLMRRVEQRASTQGGGRSRERPEVKIVSRLDIGVEENGRLRFHLLLFRAAFRVLKIKNNPRGVPLGSTPEQVQAFVEKEERKAREDEHWRQRGIEQALG